MTEFKIRGSRDESLNKTIRMKSSLIEEITALADEHGISFNALVVQMCEFALLHLPGRENAGQEEDKNSG